jgi:hypothetical protein
MMIYLSGKQDLPRAYALIRPEIPGEAPEYTFFGWPEKVAERFMLWAYPRIERTRDELEAAFEALKNPQIEKLGYKLVEAHTVIVREAAWTCDLDDIRIYYEGPQTEDEYEIREWVELNISDLSIQHVLLDLLAQADREFDDPAFRRQVAAQLDEDG